MPAESAFLDVNGVRLHYLAWGDPDGPPVVLNHATGFLAALWAPLAERLAGAGYRVHAYDARGHGDSDKPSPEDLNAYHWQVFADDLKAVLDVLGLRDVPLVGHSMGGATGLWLAAHEPAYLSRLAVFEPIVIPGGFPMDRERLEVMSEGARRRRMVFATRDEMVEQYRARQTFCRWPEAMLRRYADDGAFQREDGRIELKCPGEVEAAVFMNSASLDVSSALPDIRVPVLVLRGEHSDAFMDLASRGVAERVQNARLAIVPDAGHLGPMECPDAVADAVLAFLREG